jgi:hypothetical protein
MKQYARQLNLEVCSKLIETREHVDVQGQGDEPPDKASFDT